MQASPKSPAPEPSTFIISETEELPVEAEFPKFAWCYPDYVQDPVVSSQPPTSTSEATPVVRIPPGWSTWTPAPATTKTPLWKSIKVVNPQALKVFGRYQFTLPYLEDSNREMFVQKVKKLNVWRMWEMESWPKQQRKKYKYMLDQVAKAPEQVFSTLKITQLIQIEKMRFLDLWVSVYTVKREDDKTYMFTEADFPKMNVRDILSLYNILRDTQVKPADVQDAEVAIKRFMRFRCNYFAAHDFQLAMEARQEAVNLQLPCQTFSGIERYTEPYTVLQIPEVGVLYPDEEGVLTFLWVDELNKYSDGTLKEISLNLGLRLLSTQISREEGRMWISPIARKTLIRKINDDIKLRLSLRETIREFERAFGIRERMWTVQP